MARSKETLALCDALQPTRDRYYGIAVAHFGLVKVAETSGEAFGIIDSGAQWVLSHIHLEEDWMRKDIRWTDLGGVKVLRRALEQGVSAEQIGIYFFVPPADFAAAKKYVYMTRGVRLFDAVNDVNEIREFLGESPAW